MKRAISILLFAVFLFNVGGYYVVFWALRQQAARETISQIDNNMYPTGETLEVKVPLALPYGLNRSEYTRANALYQQEGLFYRLVKFRYDQDTLHIIYIRDRDQKILTDTMNRYAQESTSSPASTRQCANLLAKLLTDFESGPRFEMVGATLAGTFLSPPVYDFAASCYPSTSSPPPKG